MAFTAWLTQRVSLAATGIIIVIILHVLTCLITFTYIIHISVDLDSITNTLERQSYEIQIREFGQTPKQLFTSPHPTRNVRMYLCEDHM